MSDSHSIRLTDPEQRATLVMARWAVEAGYRRLSWSVPNDASWPYSYLVGLPVRYTGLPGRYDLLGRARWRGEGVVCSLLRSGGGFELVGVPGAELLRPILAPPAGPVTPTADPEPAGDEPERVPSPLRARPRMRLTAGAVALAIPVIALGGLAIRATEGEQVPPPDVAAPSRILPAPIPPLPAGAAGWAGNAQVRLAAVYEQLDTLATAEAAWTALPAEVRAGEPPAPVRELQATQAELAQQRAVLEADLAAWEALQEVRAQLADTEEQLAQVRGALELGETGATGQLREQEDRLRRQAAAQQGQLGTWRQGVDAAVAAPLPEPVDATPTADAVMAITQDPPVPQGEAPPVVAGREVEPDASPRTADDGPDRDEPEPEPEPDGDEQDRDKVPHRPTDADGAEVEVEPPEPLPGVDLVPLPEPVEIVRGAIDVQVVADGAGAALELDTVPVEVLVPPEPTTDEAPEPDPEPEGEDTGVESRLDEIGDALDEILAELDAIEADLVPPDDESDEGDNATTEPTEPDTDAEDDQPNLFEPDETDQTDGDGDGEEPCDAEDQQPEGGDEEQPQPVPAPADPDPGDADLDDDDIEAALDEITIDLSIEDVQIVIDGQAGTADITITGMQIVVDSDDVPDAGTNEVSESGDDAGTGQSCVDTGAGGSDEDVTAIAAWDGNRPAPAS